MSPGLDDLLAPYPSSRGFSMCRSARTRSPVGILDLLWLQQYGTSLTSGIAPVSPETAGIPPGLLAASLLGLACPLSALSSPLPSLLCVLSLPDVPGAPTLSLD